MATAHCLEDIHVDADTVQRLELVTARCDQLTRQLTAVMRTLSTTCPSDEHRETYNAAWALLCEMGVPMDERFAGWQSKWADRESKR